MTRRRDDGDTKAKYMPTPAQIKAEAAKIRAENEAKLADVNPYSHLGRFSEFEHRVVRCELDFNVSMPSRESF